MGNIQEINKRNHPKPPPREVETPQSLLLLPLLAGAILAQPPVRQLSPVSSTRQLKRILFASSPSDRQVSTTTVWPGRTGRENRALTARSLSGSPSHHSRMIRRLAIPKVQRP